MVILIGAGLRRGRSVAIKSLKMVTDSVRSRSGSKSVRGTPNSEATFHPRSRSTAGLA